MAIVNGQVLTAEDFAPYNVATAAPSVGSGWTANAPLRATRFGAVVQLEGELHSGTSGSTAFTIPAGFRPAFRVTALLTIHGTSSSINAYRLNIDTSGVATLIAISPATVPSSSPGISLGAVSFRVA